MSREDTTIRNATFTKGIIGTDELTIKANPQYAFIGRSNVGKSSLINKLVGRSIAHPSSTPGKTSEINYFSINDGEFFIVDLPGYGFAKVATKDKEKFRKRIVWYFADSGARPKYTFLILDARRGITDLDKDMIEILHQEGHPYVIILNKIDKLTQKERVALRKEVERELLSFGISTNSLYETSSKTGKGIEALMSLLSL